jgi:Asp-tRNA(Asn)/Glu-tRNA(Gln) amidotransferase A subunit family amidase
MWPFSSWSESKLIADTVTSKRSRRADVIAQGLKVANVQGTVSTDEDYEYTSANAAAIASKIKSREWTVRRVMEAYIRSAARAHAKTNCLTEIMFIQALVEADKLDNYITSASSDELDSKLLLGVPVSLKDQIDYKGVDTSRGFVRCAHGSSTTRAP